MKLDHVTVLTDRLPELTSFYGALPGFRTPPASGDGYAEAINDGVTIGLFDRMSWEERIGVPAAGGTGRVLLQFTVDDVDMVFAAAVGAGGRPVAEPQDLPWGCRSAFVADPDGNLIELYRWG